MEKRSRNSCSILTNCFVPKCDKEEGVSGREGWKRKGICTVVFSSFASSLYKESMKSLFVSCCDPSSRLNIIQGKKEKNRIEMEEGNVRVAEEGGRGKKKKARRGKILVLYKSRCSFFRSTFDTFISSFPLMHVYIRSVYVFNGYNEMHGREKMRRYYNIECFPRSGSRKERKRKKKNVDREGKEEEEKE